MTPMLWLLTAGLTSGVFFNIITAKQRADLIKEFRAAAAAAVAEKQVQTTEDSSLIPQTGGGKDSLVFE